jgi:hypothetical protein
MNHADRCICEGNWRLIVGECRTLLDRKYRETRTGDEFLFFGVVHGSDDYYYGMWNRDRGMVLLSCVGSIEAQGFELIE